jgi:hypothetical protein
MNLKKYFLLYTIIPLMVLSVASSYYRFMVIEDYIAEYEVDCNPEENTCFIGCEDDNCSINYYYSVVTKKASNLLMQCGPDITNCQSAQTCLATDGEDCTINYCVLAINGDICEMIEMKTVDSGEILQKTSNSILSPDTVIESNI